MAKLANLARMTTSTTGTGSITLGSAVAGFLSFASAGVTDGDVVTYAIKDGTSSEIGRGTYTSSGTTLSRSVLRSTNSNNTISLSGSAEVFITAAAEDFLLARSVPQGRLTLSSGVPVMTSSVAATGTIYYTPYNGNCIWLYTAALGWDLRTFSELSLSMDGYTASRLHDVFAYNNSGTVTLELAAWANDTLRVTSVVRHDGMLVKSGDPTRLYLGTVYVNASNQAQFTFGTSGAGGGAATFDLWNAHNRRRVTTCVQDSTDNWTYSSSSWRSANNSTGNRVTFVSGLADDGVSAQYKVYVNYTASNYPAVGIGYDGTSVASGSPGEFIGAGSGYGDALALFSTVSVGRHYLQAIEKSDGGTPTFYGDNTGNNPNGLFVDLWA